MRLGVVIACVLCLLPARASADGVGMSFLNSDLVFGLVEPFQEGRDLYLFGGQINGRPIDSTWDVSWDSAYLASGSEYVHQTVSTAPDGTVVSSRYDYTGGIFTIFLEFLRGAEGKQGVFVAPIITLAIDASEEDDSGGGATARYILGPGMFDATVAEVLGIRRRTVGGDVYSPLLFPAGLGGDHTTPVRRAWDGSTDIELYVPETSLLSLMVLGFGLALWRYRQRAGVQPDARG